MAVEVGTWSILGAVATVLNLAGMALTQYVSHPREYEDKVKELQQERWRDLTSEIGELMEEVYEELERIESDEDAEPAWNSTERPTNAAKFSVLIKNDYDRGDLEDIEKQITAVDEPRELFDEAIESFNESIKLLVSGIVLGLVGGIIRSVAVGTDNEGIGILAISISGFLLVMGYSRYSQASEAKEKLKRMYDDYNFM